MRLLRKLSGNPGTGLAVLRICLGVFLFAKGLGKLDFLFDSTSLANRLTHWSQDEELLALSRWYSGMLIPAAPVFARLVLVGELGGGLALMAGYRTPIVASLAALMIVNFHLATGSLLTEGFLTDGSGFPLVAALMVLTLTGGDLPWRLTNH